MEITDLDWEAIAAQRLIWRDELTALKESVFRAEVETRAEFNILLATVYAEQIEPSAYNFPQDRAVARCLEAQLQDWGLALWELKVMATDAEASAANAYDALLKAVLTSIAVEQGSHQVPRAVSTTHAAFDYRERGGDIAALRTRTARTAIDVKDAYSSLLTALHTKGAMAREKRHMFFKLPPHQ
jgi:hypothetical protein